MRIRLLLVSLLTLIGTAQAAEPLSAPGLLPTEIARPLLDQDPGVAAARAALEVARQEAGILNKSPYEWTANATGQRRALDDGPRYREWTVGIERTVRLPGKAAADRNIGKATIEEAQARYGDTVNEAAQELLALWLNWLAAEHARELAVNNRQSVQDNLTVVEKRSRSGDASRLDLSIARAELAEQRRMENDAKTQASAAWSRLSARFPGVNRQLVALPSPISIGENETFWRERIIAESDKLKGAQMQMQKAQAHAERGRADKIPDPTFGVFTASEVGGEEQISGLTISIPIPGGVRQSRSSKALAEVEIAQLELELNKRQIEAEIADAVATARGAYDSLQIANEGAAAMQENANLMQRAYALGEAELQALLLARRQAIAAANSALQAQVVALKSYCGLLIDAHLIWDLQHD